ncbi:helix-turn-helix transcriptional regulator [Streptacidiphilus sp. PB12-B1b]|uniref:winged helix-turn-helix transcriptional regulator n=1 Tax=Streptacidiphilus sp. PB12-B1b TaxID=2705012 RepID=UPI0015F85EE2|nr:helix-turn-helix domain-containing protein [Streptacidiphilus sp. PB12-B1b]QMU77229.1 helix-turn-helix transcriptional regulator [Streptacidiphilus sp. PB12-B1b]
MAKRNALEAGGACSIARSLGVLGQRWTLLVVREALNGRTRFSEFQGHLGVSTDVLTQRLEDLVKVGVLERRAYRDSGSRERMSYHLTQAGRELAPVLAALMTWGDKHLADSAGPPALLRHKLTNQPVQVAFVDDDGRPVALEDVVTVPGPGAST